MGISRATGAHIVMGCGHYVHDYQSMPHPGLLISGVDDDVSVCRALRRLVRSAGHTAETFASAREFLDSSRSGRTSCLVLDIHLDGMSGCELSEQLAEDQAAIPIIFITAMTPR
jgi:FixJ family two-component response regulator